MTPYVVWMDSEHAKIFKLKPDAKPDLEEVHAHNSKDHHAGPTHHQAAHQGENKFYHTLATKLKDASEILVLGPGIPKSQFKHHLESHHHADLLKKVVAFESMDHATDGQILDTAHRFFREYGVFQK